MLYSRSSGGTCYEKLCWTHMRLYFSSSNYECGTRKHTTKPRMCTKGSRVKPTQARRTAMLTLASCVLLLLLLLLFAAGEAMLSISSSGATCYEKLSLLGKTCQVQIFRVQVMPSFEFGFRKHTTNSSTSTKGLRVRR